MIKTVKLSDAQTNVLSGPVEYSASGHVAVTSGRENTLASLRKLGLLNGNLLTVLGNNARVSVQSGDVKITITDQPEDLTTFYTANTPTCAERYTTVTGTVATCQATPATGHTLCTYHGGTPVGTAEDVFDMYNLTDAQVTVLETNIGRVPETIAAAREILSDNRTTAWAHAGRYYVPNTSTLLPTVDPAAYSSAVHNANDTAREEGWTRLSQAWFTCLDYSYESMRVENETIRQQAAFYAEQDAEHCPNCQQTHPVEDAELHAAPCFVCAGDGHSGCQHGDDAPATINRHQAHDETHAIQYVGDDMTMCDAPVKGMDGIKRVSVDPSDATCRDCITAERHVAAEDANPGPTDDETNAEILTALGVAERHLPAVSVPADLPLTLSLTPMPNGRLMARVGAYEKPFMDNPTAKMQAAFWARQHGARGNGKAGRFDWRRAGHGMMIAPAHFG